jgi:hypothetical protein
MANRNDRIASENQQIAMLKQELHRQANGRLKAALENGFWIEAICIEESLMSDRIESYFKRNHESRRITNLGTWCHEILSSQFLASSDVPIFKDVQIWCKSRNLAVHEVVKVSDSHKDDWNARMAECMEVAKIGKKLAAEVNKWSRRIVK